MASILFEGTFDNLVMNIHVWDQLCGQVLPVYLRPNL
jgi:hypothetical protein